MGRSQRGHSSHVRLPDWPWLLAAAALAGLATPPVHLSLPSFIFLAPAVVLIERGQEDAHPLRRHVRQGFIFGFATNLVVLNWLPVAVWRLQPRMVWVAAAILLGLGAATGLLFVLTGAIARRLRLSMLWIFPSLWIALEWLQAHLGPLSFPQLGPAASLTALPVLLQLAEIVGSRGLDWLLVAANAALGLAWLSRHNARGKRLSLAVIGATLMVAAYGTLRMKSLPQHRVGSAAIVQPNVGFRLKWDRVSQDSALAALIAASRKLIVQDAPDLVIWPEVAVPDLFQNRPYWRAWITRLAAETTTPLVVGGLDQDAAGAVDRHFNAAFLFRPSPPPGPSSVYHKRHLVPWVEWLPPGRSRTLPFGATSSGDTGVVFRVGGISASVIICFEAAFAETVRDDRLRGADVVLNLSNDSWVSGTSGSWLGPAHLVLRAIENRIGIVRAANTGPSQFIRPDGVVVASTSTGVPAVLTGPVWSSPVRTLYTRIGDWVGPVAVTWSVLLMMGAIWQSGSATSSPKSMAA